MNPIIPTPVPPTHRPVVVVKFRPGTDLPYEADAQEKTATASMRESWRNVQGRFPKATLKPLYQDDFLSELRDTALSPAAPGRRLLPVEELSTLFGVELQLDEDPDGLTESLQAMPETEYAYVIGGPTPPPDYKPEDDPLAVLQGYALPAPVGIDVRHAQNFPGGDGRGIQFIDLEQGWILKHEDLLAANIRLLWGVNHAFSGHGTAVLGQIMASDNTKGIVGIARGCQASVVSQWKTPDQYRTDEAILAAVKQLHPGDVLLVEAQVAIPTGSGNFFPVEVEPLTLNAMRIAYNKGIIVIEAAGNGGKNLDAFPGGILKRGSPSFAESGAIMVGAASANVPHRRLSFSNFGTRVDCYGWGENITTTGDGGVGTSPSVYTNNFGGTSGASPIVAGAALVIQAVQQATGGTRLFPEDMLAILTNSQTTTISANTGQDQIGVMPDLRRILDALFGNTV